MKLNDAEIKERDKTVKENIARTKAYFDDNDCVVEVWGISSSGGYAPSKRKPYFRLSVALTPLAGDGELTNLMVSQMALVIVRPKKKN